uniref:Uncharacterized protein n=1 Tax=Romanomermis culicivorax TaxID=13658 RepID=A0A915HMC3_ROMCU
MSLVNVTSRTSVTLTPKQQYAIGCNRKGLINIVRKCLSSELNFCVKRNKLNFGN